MSKPALVCTELWAGYGPQPAIRSVSIALAPGRLTGLFGPNGAGKTTLLRTVAGLIPAMRGEVSLDGIPFGSAPTYLRVRRGLGLIPDNRSLFTQLSTRVNLELARQKSGLSLDEALDLFPALRGRLKVRAAQLSGGEQQMLAIARALMPRPRVLLVDEMSLGLAPLIVNRLLPVLRDVAREADMAILLVEQHVRIALQYVDHVYVLVHGELQISCPADDVRHDPSQLQALYLSEGVPSTMTVVTEECAQ
jgi:branched-chain amino acid transport system ATP-binding protein